MSFFGPLEPREVGPVNGFQAIFLFLSTFSGFPNFMLVKFYQDDVVVITVLSFGGKNGHQPAMKKRYTRKNT